MRRLSLLSGILDTVGNASSTRRLAYHPTWLFQGQIMLGVRNVSTTMRQPVVEIKLGF